MNALDVLIVGGGIGGLASAIALRNAGHRVQVFERAPAIAEVGAGLSLWSNATRALRQIGLGRIVRDLSVPAMSGGTFTWSGRPLTRLTSEKLAARFPDPTIVFHRSDLIQALQSELDGDVIRCSAACTSFEQDTRGVTIVLASGERVRGDVLIGADGIHSVVRRGLGHPCLPRYAGYTAWRGVTWLEQSGLAPEQPFWGVYIGRGAQVGLAPMSEGRVYWFATANTEADGHVGPGGHRADLEQKFGTWAEPVLRILTATPEEAILRNDIVDLPPLRAWGGGCVTLLGDAAHATTPNMGQGACMALEDAVVLARSLSEAAHVSSALRRYEARRVTRTRRVVRQSWTLGRIFQLESPLLCWLRDRMLSLVSPERQLEAMAWLLDYDGTRD